MGIYSPPWFPVGKTMQNPFKHLQTRNGGSIFPAGEDGGESSRLDVFAEATTLHCFQRMQRGHRRLRAKKTDVVTWQTNNME